MDEHRESKRLGILASVIDSPKQSYDAKENDLNQDELRLAQMGTT